MFLIKNLLIKQITFCFEFMHFLIFNQRFCHKYIELLRRKILKEKNFLSVTEEFICRLNGTKATTKKVGIPKFGFE